MSTCLSPGGRPGKGSLRRSVWELGWGKSQSRASAQPQDFCWACAGGQQHVSLSLAEPRAGDALARGEQESASPAPGWPRERGSIAARGPLMLCLCRGRDWLPQAGVAEPAVIMSRRAPSMLTSHYLCYCNYIIRCFMQNYSLRTN